MATEVVRGVNYRAFLTRTTAMVRRYTVLGTTYVASGYYTPDSDPYVWFLKMLGSQPTVLYVDGLGLAPDYPGAGDKDDDRDYEEYGEQGNVEELVEDDSTSEG